MQDVRAERNDCVGGYDQYVRKSLDSIPSTVGTSGAVVESQRRPTMRLTDAQVKEATQAMRERQEVLKMGTYEIDMLERLALKGDPGARLVVFQAHRRLVAK